ncbi:hypothetical protein CRUP_010178 [Coryphaenoides rupestris]|nr:hypothetical protein CRUP_010178 [Coryphaenoides rupestris]
MTSDLDAPSSTDDMVYPADTRSAGLRSASRLSHSSCGSGPYSVSSFPLGLFDSEEEEEDEHRYILDHHRQPHQHHQRHHPLSSHRGDSPVSLDSLSSASAPAPQITELNRRMSLVESMLNRLERRVVSPSEKPSMAPPESPAAPEFPPSSSPFLAVGGGGLEEQQRETRSFTSDEVKEGLSQRGFRGLLFELEDKVAQAAATVQSTCTQFSYIENRIAALSAAGMTVNKLKRRSAIPVPATRREHSQGLPTSQVDKFVRNSLYTGSLTQRNPVARPQNRTTCASVAMRACVLICALMLVVSHSPCGALRHGSRESLNIRHPDIDASWYKGRGIRPVGRFGRRVKGRGRHPGVFRHSLDRLDDQLAQ